MLEWIDRTDTFSESQRHYKDTYLEICEVAEDILEVNLFSSEVGPYEIYVSFDYMYGIIYTNTKEEYELRQNIKKDLEEEYNMNPTRPSHEFVKEFVEKYHLCLPSDVLFDTDKFMEGCLKMFDEFDRLNERDDDDEYDEYEGF